MAEHFYECLFLLDPNKASADWDAAMGRANGILERHGAQIAESRHWGDPKLAYPIKKFRKGSYLLTYFTSDAKNLPAMEADCRLEDLILRQMILKLHPQIADDIQAHLRGEAEEDAAEVASEAAPEAAPQ